MKNSNFYHRALNILRQFGVDPRKAVRASKGLPKYIYNLRAFKREYKGVLKISPYLTDWFNEAGAIKSEYFLQDLTVARWIYELGPNKHADVGSRIDGFIGHIASFRDVDVFDIRPITVAIPHVTFLKLDIMNKEDVNSVTQQRGAYDSLSCLHAIEHFGLGRYGDSISTKGYSIGFHNLASMLKMHGLLFLSTPIGKERVEFNANWVFNPDTIYAIALENGLYLEKCAIIGIDNGQISVKEYVSPLSYFSIWSQSEYLLCIFVFKKVDHANIAKDR